MNHTKDDWRVEDETQIVAGERLVANTGGYASNVKPARLENIGNAHLIAAAVNACKEINPDNPMAVAESIKELREALKEITELAPRDKLNSPYAKQVVEIADKALAKAEVK